MTALQALPPLFGTCLRKIMFQENMFHFRTIRNEFQTFSLSQTLTLSHPLDYTQCQMMTPLQALPPLFGTCLRKIMFQENMFHFRTIRNEFLSLSHAQPPPGIGLHPMQIDFDPSGLPSHILFLTPLLFSKL